jgi:hypothetical protein
MNNPLKYTDPTGNKWWHWALGDVLSGGILSLTGITTGATTFVSAITTVTTTLAFAQASLPAIQSTTMALDQTHSFFYMYANGDSKKFENAWKIDIGMLMHIPGWETEQAMIGNTISHYRNMTGNVDNVEINRGSVLVVSPLPTPSCLRILEPLILAHEKESKI